MKKLIVALLVAAAAVPAAAAPFNFTQTISYAFTRPNYDPAAPVTISGTFDGDANGNIISNISNVTLVIGGVVIAAPLYVARYDGQFHSGGATLSFDGTANDALFINSDYPADPSFTAYYYSISLVGGDSFQSDAFAGSYVHENGASSLQITAGDADVPEPAMLGLFGLGAIGLGLSRRRKAA